MTESGKGVQRQDRPLVGHVNPLGTYPAPVAPVVLVEGQPYVVFDAPKGDVAPRPFHGAFVEHVDAGAASLDDFDPEHERLFALTKSTVLRYSPEEGSDFVRRLMDRHGLLGLDPFVALELVQEARLADLVPSTMEACARRIRRECEAFADLWWQEERATLAEVGLADGLPETFLTTSEQSCPSIYIRSRRLATRWQRQSSPWSAEDFATGAAAVLVVAVVSLVGSTLTSLGLSNASAALAFGVIAYASVKGLASFWATMELDTFIGSIAHAAIADSLRETMLYRWSMVAYIANPLARACIYILCILAIDMPLFWIAAAALAIRKQLRKVDRG